MISTWSRNLGCLLGFALAVGCSHQQTTPTKVAADDKSEPAPAKRPAEAPEEPPAIPPEATVADGPDAIFFDFDSAILRDDARDTLAKLATEVKQRDDAKLAIEGNCDALGTVEYNLALGQHRAEAAKVYLIQMGVPKKRIKTASYGSQRPKYPGRDEDAYAKNRRDDLIVR
jgi:peptidoglycan-associated lipoprotein